jgi:sugar-specific transcriptional regulator TrmB
MENKILYIRLKIVIHLTEKYPNIAKFLRGLKGLSEGESLAFFKICNRESVSVKEVMQIFLELKIKISRSRAYTIVEKFKREGLIFPISGSVKSQRYKAVHPKALFNDLKDGLKDLDVEIGLLSESYEIQNFEIKDPRKLSKTLNSEREILTVCNSLCSESDLIIISDNTPEFKHLNNALSDISRIIDGRINLILFSNSKNNDKGVITLTKRTGKGGTIRIFGQIIYDRDKFNYFYDNEVRRNG